MYVLGRWNSHGSDIFRGTNSNNGGRIFYDWLSVSSRPHDVPLRTLQASTKLTSPVIVTVQTSILELQFNYPVSPPKLVSRSEIIQLGTPYLHIVHPCVCNNCSTNCPLHCGPAQSFMRANLSSASDFTWPKIGSSFGQGSICICDVVSELTQVYLVPDGTRRNSSPNWATQACCSQLPSKAAEALIPE